MTDTVFTFHTDPGHGWIEVDLHAMRQAGLQPSDFSRYSYRKRNVFYLEEDCDASKFIAAWQEKTGKHATFRDAYQAQSFIRNLPSIRDEDRAVTKRAADNAARALQNYISEGLGDI